MRNTMSVLTLLLAFAAGCGKSQSTNTNTPIGTATIAPPQHEQRSFTARLVETSNYDCLEVTGIGSLNGTVREGSSTLGFNQA